MTKFTQHEIEEAKHEAWVLSGGRQDFQDEHQIMACQQFSRELKGAGWRVLEHDLVSDDWHEVKIIEAVVRRGDSVKLIRWNTFNKGWMERSPSGGWVIFKPEQ